MNLLPMLYRICSVTPAAMKKVMFITLILSAFLFSNSARAGTTYTWTGLGLNFNWTTAANWSPATGYPGKTGNSDIAVVNLSLLTINLTSSVTISQLQTTLFGITGVNINLVGSSTVLTISNGFTTAQPALFSIVLTFSGSGTALISGTSTCGYAGTMSVSSGTTVTFEPNSVLDFTSNQGTLTNAGTLQFLSGSNFEAGYKSGLSNTGTVTLSGAAFTMSGSPCSLANSGTLNATSSTFALSGSTIPITNSGIFTTNKCTITSSNSGCSFTNTGTYNDHGSTISFTGQNNTIANSGASCVMNLKGITINFSGGNNGHIFSSAGTVTADSSSTINLGTFHSQLGNQGTFYAGISNSPCIINLSAQGSNISNTGTLYVGSTSGITMSGSGSAIATSGTFTFQSDAFGTGYLGSVPATSTSLIVGTFNVQRYITGGSPAYRGYRLFSSPVYASTVSSNNVYSLNYVKNSALVTGSGGTAGGFDKTGNPSLYLYRENIAYSNATYISGNFRGVANIASAPSYTMDADGGPFNIPVGNGFLFWFRGDRTSNLANKYTPGTLAESVTMTTTGAMNVGQVTVHDWYTPASADLGYTTTAGNTAVRGDNLVGNPYPSSIDWETFQTTTATTGIYGKNVSNTMYVLDQVNQNYGAYIKGGGGLGTNNATNIVASGQGFFVTATSSTTPQLIFNETAKSASQVTGANLLMSTGGAVTVAGNPYLRLQMAMDSVNTDDMLLRFNNSASMSFVDSEDAQYKPGFGQVSISSISADNINLAINTVPYPKNSETIPLNISAKADGVYQLTLKNISQVPRLYDVWLMDAYKKDSLDMRQNLTYAFNIYHADTTSYGSKRFTLVIRQNPQYAYQLLSFSALRAANGAQVSVKWTTQNEGNYTYFTVERSTDGGVTYNVIGSVAANGLGAYGLLDTSPAEGANYYRLEQEDINNNITYSKVVEVIFSGLSNGITGALIAYPNPAMSAINLSITPQSPGENANYSITITNSAGITVKQITTAQTQWQGAVSDLIPGAYTIRVVNSRDNSLVGDTRFVKL